MKASIAGSPKLLAEKTASDSLVRSASSMGIATLLSRVMGLVREQAFAYLFGAGNFTDAFNVAFRIPNLLRNLFAEGAMSASLVPVFTKVREEEGEQRAWRVAGLVFRVLFVVVAFFSVIGIVFAPQFVSLYAGAFRAVPGKFELTVRMTRIIFPFFPLVALSAAFMGVLNACGVFFLPALASALFNVVSVAVGVFFALVVFAPGSSLGFSPIEGMAVGIVAGGLVQAVFQLPSLYRAGYCWVQQGPKWYRDPALRRMLGLMAPGVVGLAATQVNILVNTMLATSQGPGAVSWLSYSFRLMQFPIGIFGVSLASAALPLLSRFWVLREAENVRETLLRTLNHVWAVNLPASVGLAVLGAPIVALLFQYGRFTPEDTHATALALAMYSIGLAAYSGVKVLVPACYAVGNTRIPVLTSALSIVIGVGLNLILIRPLGYLGLALATSASSIFNMVFLLFAMGRILKEHDAPITFGHWILPFLRHLAISLIMGLICWESYKELNSLFPENLGFHHETAVVAVLRAFKVGLIAAEGIGVVIFLDIFLKNLKKKLSPRAT
jgi:putative peptidoglycan lipid II flippase